MGGRAVRVSHPVTAMENLLAHPKPDRQLISRELIGNGGIKIAEKGDSRERGTPQQQTADFHASNQRITTVITRTSPVMNLMAGLMGALAWVIVVPSVHLRGPSGEQPFFSSPSSCSEKFQVQSSKFKVRGMRIRNFS